MKMPYRVFAILLSLALFVGIGGVAVASEAQEPYNIKLLTIWSPSDAGNDGAIMFKLAEEYCAANPNFSFEYDMCEQFDMPSKLSVLISSNDVPDIFIYEDGGALDALVERDAIVNISKDFSKLGFTLEDLYSETALRTKHTLSNFEDIYSLPHRIVTEGVWYNKTLFAEHGLEAPETWAEMEALCDKLLALGIQPFATSGLTEWPITRWIMLYASRLEGNTVHLDASRLQNGRRFTDEVFVKAAAKAQEMFQKGYFGTGFNSIDYFTMNSMFMTGKAAMVYNGSWVTSQFSSNLEGELKDTEIGIFNVPGIEGSKISLEEADGINALNTNMAICLGKAKFDAGTNNDFLKYVFENFGERQQQIGAMTAYDVDFRAGELTPMAELFVSMLDKVKSSTLWFEAKMDSGTSDVALENAQLLAEGTMTPEEYCERLATAVDEAMAN